MCEALCDACCDTLTSIACCCCKCCCTEETKGSYSKRDDSKNTEKWMRCTIFILYGYVIILAVTLNSFLWDSWIYAVSFIILYCYSLYLIEKLRYGNPGSINIIAPSPTEVKVSEFEVEAAHSHDSSIEGTSTLKQRNSSHMSGDLKLEVEEKPKELPLPPRAKYCKICEIYVAKYDHHCVWIGNCVGEKNQLDFLLFLFVEFLFLLYCLIVCFNVCYRMATTLSHASETSVGNVISLVIILPTAITNLIFMLFPCIMFGHNLYLVCLNQTSYESYKMDQAARKKQDVYIYDEGCRTNILRFIQQNRLQRHEFITWKPILQKRSTKVYSDDCCECCDCPCCGPYCERVEKCCSSV